jgi:hypothetical protein
MAPKTPPPPGNYLITLKDGNQAIDARGKMVSKLFSDAIEMNSN